jgi:hypothetical protein
MGPGNPIGKVYCEHPRCYEEADHLGEHRGLAGEPVDDWCAPAPEPVSPFRAHTGLMGATESGQVVTAENMHYLPPGSTVRVNDGEWLVHLHDGRWLRIFNCGHCYDRAERFHCLLPGYLCHHP